MYDLIDDAKHDPDLRQLVYRLPEGDIYATDSGIHFLDHLDPELGESKVEGSRVVSAADRKYIEESLQSSSDRFRSQARFVSEWTKLNGARVLDIGCGGGRFLEEIETRGANGLGLEVNPTRIAYLLEYTDLEVHSFPLPSSLWDRWTNSFDVVTLWDVIEHVNYPAQVLRRTKALLKRNGLLFLDTPCRDSIYYRLGDLAYRATRGRCTHLLNVMYSNERFGHKQIFHTREMRGLLAEIGYEVQFVERFHELSFPLRHYTHRLIGNQAVADALAKLASIGFRVFKIRNKQMVVARKT